ncbi:MAG: leucine-rich repeat domain-containing protein [Treponema sp.]|nr:leucine-rich repeat domain-containing protein [Treponema sp.]
MRNYAEENATVKVKGELLDTNAIYAALLEFSGDRLSEAPSKLVALDLSETTGLTTISFRMCTSLASIQLPDSVTEIGYEAFHCCRNLKNITLPNGLTTIGDNAFYGCTLLENLTIPASVTRIGRWAFNGCHGLDKVIIPEGVTEIADYAFSTCYGLMIVILPSTCKKIGDGAFGGTRNLNGISLPEGLTEIGEYAFSNSGFLVGSIEIPSTVTVIGPKAFYNCVCLVSYNSTGPTGIKFKDTARWNHYYDDAHNSSPCDVSDPKVNAEHLVRIEGSSEIEHTWSRYGLFKR